jgi:probable phosphoglycerate mutase
MILYYVRHGDPIYDPDSLTELGHKQAEALSKRFEKYGLDEIYASTSMRAQMTAQPTCEKLGKEMTLLDWANEGRAWSDFNVKNEKGEGRWAFHVESCRRQLNAPEVRAMGEEWYKHPYFADTNFARGVNRINTEVDAFFAKLGFVHDRENACYRVTKKNQDRVALFAHEGFGKIFLSSVLDIPYPIVATKMELGHSSVTVIFFDEKVESCHPRLLQWSNDSHLYKEDVLTGYQNWIDI